jgi:uncharacterized protein (DUF433 family)
LGKIVLYMTVEESSIREWITSTPTVLDGKPRVKNRRLGVHFLATQVVEHENEPGAVADRYDVPVEAVQAAVSYYRENPQEMDQIESRRTKLFEQAQDDPSVPTTPQEMADLSSGSRTASD